MNKAKKYDTGKPRLDLLSTEALNQIASVMAFGASKYGEYNWRGGLAWSRVIGAALRHLYAFNKGEDNDPETGISHLAHAGCCVMFLLEYLTTHPELDNRYKPLLTPHVSTKDTENVTPSRVKQQLEAFEVLQPTSFVRYEEWAKKCGAV